MLKDYLFLQLIIFISLFNFIYLFPCIEELFRYSLLL